MATALTATGDLPLVERQRARILSTAATTTREDAVAKAPFAGSVTASFIPDVIMVPGASDVTRTFSLINRGQSGTGGGAGTTMASLALATSMSDLLAFDERVITASTVSGAVDVAAGDIVTFKGTAGGTGGLASPAGLVVVTFTRA